MRSEKSRLRVFLTIAIGLTAISLCWIFLTPTHSSASGVNQYSNRRIIAIALEGVLLLVFSLGFFFSKRNSAIGICEKLLKSVVIHFVSITILIISLLLLLVDYLNVITGSESYLERLITIIFLAFFLSIEILLFQRKFFRYQNSKTVKIPGISQQNKLNLIVLLIMVGFSFAIGYHYFQGVYLSKPYPQNTFLFRPDDRFNDFYNPIRGSADLDPFRPDKITYKGGYPPFGYLVAFLFSLITPWSLSLVLYIIAFFLSFIFFMRYFLFNEKRQINLHDSISLFVLTFLSYPIIFAIDRANFDLIICIMLFLFVLFYQKNKFILSALFLGIAVAIKPFAGLLILIYLFDKKFMAALILLLNVFVLSLLSLSLFKDGLFVEAQKFFIEFTSAGKMIVNGSIAHFSSDLYNFLVILIPDLYHLFGRDISLLSNSIFKLTYVIFALTMILFYVFYCWKNPQSFWKKLLILTCLIILLPFASGDYRLIYFFPAMILFITTEEKGIYDLPITILLGLLFIPKNYLILEADQNIGMLINPIIIILVIYFVIRNKSQAIKKSEMTLREGITE